MRAWWDEPYAPNPLPECPHCGRATARAAYEANGAACSSCRGITCEDPHLAGRLWLVEWQETVQRIQRERAAAEAERLDRLAAAAADRRAANGQR